MTREKKRQIILIAGVIVLVAVVLGLFWMAFTAEDRAMAKAAGNHPQGEKFLQQYRDAKAEFKDYPGAIESYKKSYEFNPNSMIALNNLGDIYTRMENYSKAEEMYLESIGKFSDYTQSYYALIDLYRNYMQEKKENIEKVLLKGLEGLPNDQNLLSLLAGYYRETKQIDKAIVIYEKILALRPNDLLIKEEIENLKAGK